MRQHMLHTPYLVGEAHFYSAEIAGELVLFDTGPPTADALTLLKKEIDLPRLKYLFITHCHVDHYGLSEYIAAHTDAQIFLPRKDIIKLSRQAEVDDALSALLAGCGFDKEYVSQLFKIFMDCRLPQFTSERYRSVDDSDIPAKLGISCLPCPGHSQSDMVYLVGNYAVTGDILLRNVFQAPLLEVDLTNFSGRFRNYVAYCNSLVKLQQLKGFKILPGHRSHVDDLDMAIMFYVKKFLERARQVKRHAAVRSVCAVMDALFGRVESDPMVRYLKASEILFIRDFLAAPYALKNALSEIGLFDCVSDLYGDVAG